MRNWDSRLAHLKVLVKEYHTHIYRHIQGLQSRTGTGTSVLIYQYVPYSLREKKEKRKEEVQWRKRFGHIHNMG